MGTSEATIAGADAPERVHGPVRARAAGPAGTTKPDGTSSTPPHSPAEDLHALAVGAGLAAFGLLLLRSAGLTTGGVAGMALVGSYLLRLPLGALFVALNAPLLLLAGRRMGPAFVARSLTTMTLVAALVGLTPRWIGLERVDPWFAALFGGSLIGMGMLSLVRHRSSVGGVSMLAFHLQESRGWSAGVVQLACDGAVLMAAAAVLDARSLACSALSAVAQNLVVAFHHRPGRYAGT